MHFRRSWEVEKKLSVEGTYLEEIVAHHRVRAARDGRPRDELFERAKQAPVPPSFRSALALPERQVSLIAECKRRSPSRGELAEIPDPLALADSYARGGAAAISVLTDQRFFSGSLDDLRAISAGVSVPCLRKDFTVDLADLCDAKLAGASAVLLIVAALAEDQLEFFLMIAAELGLGALVEVHSRQELAVANSLGASIIGVNQRNLHDFSINHKLGAELIGEIDRHAVKVIESGITTVEQVAQAAEAGFDAMLVGEALVRDSDPAAGAARFVAAGRAGA